MSKANKGMKLLIVVPGALLALCSGMAKASEWARVGSYKGTTSYVDKTSTRTKSRLCRLLLFAAARNATHQAKSSQQHGVGFGFGYGRRDPG